MSNQEATQQTIQLPRAGTYTLLTLWHLLSLDAPTVATLWLVFVAHATHTVLPSLLATAMFLAVWIIYAADRLLDTRLLHKASLLHTEPLEARHHFHQRHRLAFLAGLVVATGTLSLLLARTRLPPAYLPLGAIFLAWFAAVHLPRIPASARLPKELATGLIFAVAVFAPELSRQALSRQVASRHTPEALAFALLCAFNCAWITRWETPPPTHPLTRGLVHHLPELTAVLSLAVIFFSPISAAIALSATALLALDRFRDRLSPTTLRAAAVLALLTPALFLVSTR